MPGSPARSWPRGPTSLVSSVPARRTLPSGQKYYTPEIKHEIPLDNATEHPLDNSRNKSTGRVTILWNMPLTREIRWKCHWTCIGTCHWKSTMMYEVLISGVLYFAPILRAKQVTIAGHTCLFVTQTSRLYPQSISFSETRSWWFLHPSLDYSIQYSRGDLPLWLPRWGQCTPNLPTNIVPTNNAWLKLSGKFPMDMRIPPL